MRAYTHLEEVFDYIKFHPGTTLDRMRIVFQSKVVAAMIRLQRENRITYQISHEDGRKKRWYVKVKGDDK